VSLDRQRSADLPPRIAERVAEQSAIARANGLQIVANPKVAIKALTHYQASFTDLDIAKFLHTRTEGVEQFREAFLKVTTSRDLEGLGRDNQGNERYVSRDMLGLAWKSGRVPQITDDEFDIDEAGSVGKEHLTQVLQDAAAENPKVVFSGDSRQLPASEPSADRPKIKGNATMAAIDAVQQGAAERWRDKQRERAPDAFERPVVPVEQRRELKPESIAGPRPRREQTYRGPEDGLEI
jgi:hypothetical protein